MESIPTTCVFVDGVCECGARLPEGATLPYYRRCPLKKVESTFENTPYKWRFGDRIADFLARRGIKKTKGCGCHRRQAKCNKVGAYLYFIYIRLWNDNSLLMRLANMVCRDCFGKAGRRKAIRKRYDQPISLQEKTREEAKNLRREELKKLIESKNK